MPHTLTGKEDLVFFFRTFTLIPSHHIKVRTTGPYLQFMGRLELSHAYCFVTDAPFISLENGSQFFIISLLGQFPPACSQTTQLTYS
jgi:hypothetical protein